MNFLSRQQIIRYSIPDRVEPRILLDTELISVRTARSGIFWALTKAGDQVEVGQPLAEILDPYEGDRLETLYAPVDGVVFFIHDEPLTYADTVVIKLVKG